MRTLIRSIQFDFFLVLISLVFQDDSGAHGEHQDPISLAVEMAAVNHSILALSRAGGVPNDIKTESLEDEWIAQGAVVREAAERSGQVERKREKKKKERKEDQKGGKGRGLKKNKKKDYINST